MPRRPTRYSRLSPNNLSAYQVIEFGKLLIHISIPSLKHLVLVARPHPAAGVFAVPAVELLYDIPPFHYFAERSEGRLRIIHRGVVAQIDVNLRRARSRPGIGKGDIAWQIVNLQRVVRNRLVAPLLRHLGITSDSKLNPASRNHTEES